MTKKTERENLKAAQKHFAALCRIADQEIKRWKDPENAKAAGMTPAQAASAVTAWYDFKSKVMGAHASGSRDLMSLFPEHADIITNGPSVLIGGR